MNSCYLNTKNKADCSGCAACSQICPKSAIDMKADSDGFLYPFINQDKCISCGLCEKVCLNIRNSELQIPIEAYAAVSKDSNSLMLSSSGGAFFGILSAVSNDTKVCGAAWETRSKVKHKISDLYDAYNQFRKSKYVQSDLADCFKEIKTLLKNDEKVLFTGTPCQVSALKAFLGKDYDNLISVDLICHGISSSEILESCLKSFDKKNDKIEKVTFRYKRLKGKKWDSKLIKFDYKSGKNKILDYNHCGFLRAYGNSLILRPSCHSCKYACSERCSDITLGDFWGGEGKGYNPHKGASLIIVNTEKGRALIPSITEKVTLEKIDYAYAVANNRVLRKPFNKHPSADFFLKEIRSSDFETVIKKVMPASPIYRRIGAKIKRAVWNGKKR